ncbi:aminotransferase class V-fold PLP-dependent enzyme [Glacieibacterium sp.]|uniref:aminotransferase class V-fold PLP-dependent enzyme n=1 Tax=Glacieibacterium sp. TaxID=2860237 RepID=UPI003AFF9569
MAITRRHMMGGTAAALPMLAGTATLPDRNGFGPIGAYLDAAFTHPLGAFAVEAGRSYLKSRFDAPQAVGPRGNPRRAAVERFARLVNVDPHDIAVVPSTLDGENLVNLSLGTGPGAGVVTDGLHYDGSLALYGELARRGAPVRVARPRGGGVDLADLRALIGPDTRLIAVSLVSSTTGFRHDLAELCSIAHARGVLVYADIIQAAGAVPLDLRASGVDFACCGTYKWLMGDFGTAFLYVRPDRLDRLKRVETGWRQVRQQYSHVLPFETPGPALGEYELAGDAAGLFEVSTPAWGALAVVAASLDHILGIGVDAVARHRRPLVDRLQAVLPGLGFLPLTPPGSASPIVAFAIRNADKRFDAALEASRINVSTYPNRIRISPSLYNDADHIERLIEVLRR